MYQLNLSRRQVSEMIEEIKRMIEDHKAEPITTQRKYAVLFPLVKINGIIHILFEVRSQSISQPGETSFPGGALEEGETFKEAAIRETEEELLIDRKDIRIIGEMDYIVKKEHIIKCFVGWLSEIDVTKLKPNEEVEDVFTIPLQYFLKTEPVYHTIQFEMKQQADLPVKKMADGKRYKRQHINQQIPFYTLSDHYLWGYTAHLTHRFSELIKRETNETNHKGDKNDKQKK